MLIPHGWPKLMAGIEPLAVILIAIETIGMAVIVYHHLPKFGWTERG